MQSYWMQTTGANTTLELRDVAVPEPGPQQVLVRVRAAGLNRGEFIAGHGLHGKSGAAKAVGTEGAGEIVRLGAGVTRLKRGDRVMGRCPGSFAEYALIDVREAIPMPAGLSWEEAAAIPLTFMVVYDMLVLQGRLAAGEWLLITGVSSGVGVAALQTAKALGAKVIGTSGSADKLERLKALGLDLGLCTRSADFYDAVMQATQDKGVNLVVNTVGGSMFAECMRTLAFQGRLATVGYVDGVLKSEIDIEALHAKRLTLFGVSNKLRSPEQRAEPVPGFIADVLPAIAQGRIRPVIDRVFAFDQLVAAKAYMESNLHLGKIVLAGALTTATKEIS
ncbi:MAG TPA: zinc-binding dehydrogenase [Burkholderiaceae bacterium]|nr:zinc-binding dehydrogenase [Burkholderiaceae bacterium]